MSDDDQMIGSAHETSSGEALRDGRTEDAKVLAFLAVASAVNRLAAAQEALSTR